MGGAQPLALRHGQALWCGWRWRRFAVKRVWPRLADKAAVALACGDTVAAAPKEGIVPVFARGDADLMLIHGSDESCALLAAGLEGAAARLGGQRACVGRPLRMIRPAAQAADGAAAMARIVAADAPGWRFATRQFHHCPGAVPLRWRAPWAARQQLRTTTPNRHSPCWPAPRVMFTPWSDIFRVAKWQDAQPWPEPVLLYGDPAMRRVYVLVEPGLAHPATPSAATWRGRLADYLLSARGQADLRAADHEAGGPWVFALTTGGPALTDSWCGRDAAKRRTTAVPASHAAPVVVGFSPPHRSRPVPMR